ncbi:Choline transport [Hyphodiscus hymeniophilus]|uniref:Choline transport n=1 Tax=Hyphodiscus hymeniophilus TaxID=353542 RepID=A0A9P7AU84_9HELO|nr:Choline transport [Hyphodiscus hymeniophilus]
MTDEEKPPPTILDGGRVDDIDEILNVSGHPQQLDRQLGFFSICALSIVADNAWAAGSGTLVVALYDGGAPGVLWEMLVASFFYFFIGAALAELASAIPSSASASASIYGAEAILALYSLYHPDFVPSNYQFFLAYLGVTWMSCSIVLFGQQVLTHIANTCAILCLLFWFISLMIVSIMPATKNGHASNHFVWTEWNNQTGYTSNGLVFCLGMLNGAFAIGTPDGCTHMAEEIPDPKRNIPKGIAAQLITGFATTWTFYIALCYAISNIDDIFSSPINELPLAAIYYQATGNSTPATTALLIIFLINNIVTIPGAYITAGRMLWTMARDDAVPFSPFIAKVSPRFRNPFNATLIVGFTCTILGVIYIGSAVAFNAFIGVFVILTTMSYLAAILPHLLSGRRFVKPGPFWMPGLLGYIVSGVACAYIIVFNILYMFPYSMPVSAETMNYSCVMAGGTTILASAWYLWKRNHGYIGPRVLLEASNEVLKGIVDEKVAAKIKAEQVRRASVQPGST